MLRLVPNAIGGLVFSPSQSCIEAWASEICNFFTPHWRTSVPHVSIVSLSDFIPARFLPCFKEIQKRPLMRYAYFGYGLCMV
ncbi:hypothetical protein AOQ84DRAFT_351430, partial [Glonium stellatum]